MSAVDSSADPDGVQQKIATWRLVKNVALLGFAFMVQFTAHHGAVNLQSSINAEAGLGMASLAAMYAGTLVSSFILPVVIIKWLGTKWTMALMFFAYVPYQLAQLYPTFYTLVPAATLLGLAGAPAWCAMCTYVAASAKAYSKITDISADAMLARLLGMFFSVFHINQVWGNLISSLVLSTGDNEAAVTSLNESMIPEICGAHFLPSDDAGETLKRQPQEKIEILVGIYLGCMAVAIIIIAVGADAAKSFAPKGAEKQLEGKALLVETMRVLMQPKQLLLVPISIFIGLQQAFVGADFTAAYVSCVIGTGTVGYVMLVHGLADALGCAVTGLLAKLMGRVRLICCALLVNTSVHLTLLLWRPRADLHLVLYVLAILLGVCNSVWLVQINSYYGIIFPNREEPAFACFRMFEAIGFIVTYTISPYMRISPKTYILFLAMVIGTIGYLCVEHMEAKVKRKEQEPDAVKEKEEKGCENAAYEDIDKCWAL